MKESLGEKGKELLEKLKDKARDYFDKLLDKLKGKRSINFKDMLKKLKDKVNCVLYCNFF